MKGRICRLFGFESRSLSMQVGLAAGEWVMYQLQKGRE